jgi:hypothetical protein
MSARPYRLAVTKVDSVKGQSFDWLATGSKPFIKLDSVDFNDSLLVSVFNLYRHVYGQINKNLFIQKKEALLKYTRWVILIDDRKQIVGFMLCREHDHGIKLGLTAAVNSIEAKNAIVELIRKAFNVKGVFGEVSPPLENKIKGYVPELEASVGVRVIKHSKKINRVDTDQKHYWREINNIGEQRKMMVGRPDI